MKTLEEQRILLGLSTAEQSHDQWMPVSANTTAQFRGRSICCESPSADWPAVSTMILNLEDLAVTAARGFSDSVREYNARVQEELPERRRMASTVLSQRCACQRSDWLRGFLPQEPWPILA